MKKYLFLLFLFIIYLVLVSMDNNKQVITYNDVVNDGVSKVLIKFVNGISSGDLKLLFNNYNKKYYVYSLKINDDKINLSCTLIEDCIRKVFNQEDNSFYINHITNGFKIDEVELIAYDDEILPFLNKNNLVYELN